MPDPVAVSFFVKGVVIAVICLVLGSCIGVVLMGALIAGSRGDGPGADQG